jgi:hypothetical protein
MVATTVALGSSAATGGVTVVALGDGMRDDVMFDCMTTLTLYWLVAPRFGAGQPGQVRRSRGNGSFPSSPRSRCDQVGDRHNSADHRSPDTSGRGH